ncbi:MAG: asparaginase [Gammaproteobacteria bacterium]|nr:asparaginase [Gammaproteobacteria bacterium]
MNESNARTRPADNPVLVEVWRGEFLESRHRGALAVVDAGGDTVLEAGDVGSPVYSRSSLKPIQALDLLESGAAARFAPDGGCICLACASHKGETEHTRRVGAWLEHIGLDVSALECGAHRPYSDEARDELVRDGRAPTALNNNCSGQARRLPDDGPAPGHRPPRLHPPGSRDPAARHAGHRRDLRLLRRRADAGRRRLRRPGVGHSLATSARAFAAFAPAARGSGARAAARGAIVDAIVHNPYLIGGGGDFAAGSSGAVAAR